MPQILVFGDSIVYGSWDLKGGWVARLRKHYDQEVLNRNDFWLLTYNLGIPGDNSEDLKARLLSDLESRLDTEEETILVFAIGINDSQVNTQTHETRVPIDTFRENINFFIQEAQRITSKIIFVGLTSVEEKNAAKPGEHKAYLNDSILKFDTALQEITAQNGILYLPLFKGFENEDLLSDGLHPNDKGHELIFQKVLHLLNAHNFINV